MVVEGDRKGKRTFRYGWCHHPDRKWMDLVKMEDEMDENVWSQLPQELVIRILARLPVFTFLQLRGVCKWWNSLMDEPLFLEMCSHVPTRECFGLCCTGLGSLYYFETSKVLLFYDHFGSWRQKIKAKVYAMNLSFLPLDSAALVGGDGGLLCFADLQKNIDPNEGVMRWWVCNPVTKKWRELPPKLTVHGWPLTVMVVKSNPFRYKVIVVWTITATWQEYDSGTHAWSADLPFSRESYPSHYFRKFRMHPHLELRLESLP